MTSNAEISEAEILQDIQDTKREIENMEAEQKHLEATPRTAYDYRWNMMRAASRRDGIVERLQFIAKLENILKERGGRDGKG